MNRIAVLGLGCSIKEFDAKAFDLSIGCNDTWRVAHSEVLVVLNKPSEFTHERLRIINESKPEAFYSQMVIWDTRPNFKKIDFRQGYPERICNLDGIQFDKSYCSPFVAVQIAFKFYDANEIHLFGCDMVDHPHLDRVLCSKIKIHFINLKTALEAKGCKLIVHGDGILKDI